MPERVEPENDTCLDVILPISMCAYRAHLLDASSTEKSESQYLRKHVAVYDVSSLSRYIGIVEPWDFRSRGALC